MELLTLEAALSLTNAHLAALDACIGRQQGVVNKLHARGRDFSKPESILVELKNHRRRCIRNRERLLAELAATSGHH